MKPEEIFNKMDYEGGFWELVRHSGLDFLKGTPFEKHIDILSDAERLADEISEYFESISEDEEYEEE